LRLRATRNTTVALDDAQASHAQYFRFVKYSFLHKLVLTYKILNQNMNLLQWFHEIDLTNP